jgi:hypothetical protein
MRTTSRTQSGNSDGWTGDGSQFLRFARYERLEGAVVVGYRRPTVDRVPQNDRLKRWISSGVRERSLKEQSNDR